MTSLGSENEQPTSIENPHQNHMEAVFGDAYTFASGDQARDQATTQAELVAAAVAAAANNSNGTAGNYHALVASAAPGNDNVIATATAQNSADPIQAAELVKREIANQKVRAENRERKKRWREQNEDRNKDNDLRCRVNKRANRLFGKIDSEAKRDWIQEEFSKRQRKRQDKERRKHTVNGSMPPSQDLASSDYQSPTSMASFTSSQLEALQQHSSDFYPMSASGIPPLSPTTATKLLNSNLAAVLKAGKNDPSATAAAAAAVLQSPQFLQLNQLLSQQSAEAAQYTTDMSTSESGNKPNEAIDYKLPLDQIAAVANAVASSQNEKDENGTNGQAGSEGEKSSEVQGESSKPANGQGSGGDYPMDAVMTLMQLNAGWRQ